MEVNIVFTCNLRAGFSIEHHHHHIGAFDGFVGAQVAEPVDRASPEPPAVKAADLVLQIEPEANCVRYDAMLTGNQGGLPMSPSIEQVIAALRGLKLFGMAAKLSGRDGGCHCAATTSATSAGATLRD